jgi:hypothetical protein
MRNNLTIDYSNTAKTVSAVTRNAHPAEVSTTQASFQKMKTITLNQRLLGGIAIRFSMRTSAVGALSWGQIYKNGVPWSISWETGDTLYNIYGFDCIGIDLPAGTTIELWLKTNVTVYAKDFQLKYDMLLSPVEISTTNS